VTPSSNTSVKSGSMMEIAFHATRMSVNGQKSSVP